SPAERAIEEAPGFFASRMDSKPERMPRRSERRNPRHVVEKLVRVRNAALRVIVRRAENREAARDCDRRQARVEYILRAVDNAREWSSGRAEQDLRCVEPGVLHSEECLVAREAKAKLVQQTGRKRMRFGDHAGPADRRIARTAELRQRARSHRCALILGP